MFVDNEVRGTILSVGNGSEASFILPCGDYNIMIYCDDSCGAGGGEIRRSELFVYSKETTPKEGTLNKEIFGMDEVLNVTTDHIAKAIQYLTELKEEEEELPRVDWSQVEVDTPILVSQDKKHWEVRHFAKVVGNAVYAYVNGRTSCTTESCNYWDYAKLLPEAELKDNLGFIKVSKVLLAKMPSLADGKLPKTDWSNVAENTLIWVREPGDSWMLAYFAKFEDGVVYTYVDGCTSYTAQGYNTWVYAKPLQKDVLSEVDWSKVEVNTPIKVRDKGKGWIIRHFAKYAYDKVYTFTNGGTSDTKEGIVFWKEAQLLSAVELKDNLGFMHIDSNILANYITKIRHKADEEVISEVDWANVKENTPVLVCGVTNRWMLRYFAGCQNGEVCTFADGCTSYTATSLEFHWKHVKLLKE